MDAERRHDAPELAERRRRLNERLRAEFIAGARRSGGSGPASPWHARSSSGCCDGIQGIC